MLFRSAAPASIGDEIGARLDEGFFRRGTDSEIRPIRPMKEVKGSNEVATIEDGGRARALVSELDSLASFDTRRFSEERLNDAEAGRGRLGDRSR